MHTLAAWYESIDPAGALVNIAGVPDQHLNVQGDNITVPVALPAIIGEAALENDASAAAAQVAAPSIRQVVNLDVEPIIAAAVFGSPPEPFMHPLNPVPVQPSDFLEFLVNSDPAAAAAHYGLVWLADGPIAPVGGRIYTLRTTAVVAQAVATWSSGVLNFTQDLPPGRYQLVGARVRSTDGVAFRLIFPGYSWRPGGPVVNAIGDRDAMHFRYGNLGVWGEFEHNLPPQLEMLGGTAAAQTALLDVIKVGG
jgi:hypothetical protein